MKDLVRTALVLTSIGIAASCNRHSGGGSSPETGSVLAATAQSLSPTTGPAPLTVLFDGSTNASALGGTVTEWSWDFDGDGTVDYTSADSGATSHTYTEAGAFDAILDIVDDSGTVAQDVVPVTVLEPLSVTVTATPKSGVWPLTVRLSPTATSSGPSVATYRWDFDGDGSFDTGFIVKPDPQYHTYTSSGTFKATVEVADEVGNTAQGSVDVVIVNPKPTASVTLAPSNGAVPLDVTINVAASSQNGAISNVSIDPGDGSPPIQLSGPGVASHTYQSAGEFGMSVTVTDVADESIVVQSPLVNVDVGPPGSPTADIKANLSSGNAPLNVTFNAAGSTTPQGSITRYEWDFDYDGTTFAPDLDTGTTSNASTTFVTAGTKYVAVRVTNDSNQSSIDVTSVLVNLNVSLAVLDDTVDPHSQVIGGDSSTIRTSLSADATVTVEMRDRADVVVRTLFSGPRTAGTYDDPWDGLDENGNILPDGDYYAWMTYTLDGLPKQVPSTPSGGSFAFVTGSENISGGAPFDPWSDEFWEMTFNTQGVGACEVTLWITPYFNGIIESTVITARPYGSGSYMAHWAGVTDDGGYVAPQASSPGSSGDYLWSAQAFTLPDNTIIVEGGSPQISDLEIRANGGDDPNIFDPTQAECDGVPGCELLVTVDRDCSIDVGIYNLETGGLVRFLTLPSALGGQENSIQWDGSALPGTLVAPGNYRFDVTASSAGSTSLLRRALTVVRY